jgi:5-formyltetrahydrofolate cyclo-ligase
MRASFATAPGDAACALLLAHPIFQAARRVGVYGARTGEINLQALWRARPEACVFPKVLSKTQMEFRTLSSWQDLRPGYARILEPFGGESVADWSATDLILVPGYGFDTHGARVGSGGGYYDRFLATCPAKPWGIGWDEQIVSGKLAQESTDVRMRGLCTQSRILVFEA